MAKAKTKTTAKSGFGGFPKQTLKFLSELRDNNDRAWFNANKQRYEDLVLEPALGFIRAFAPKLKKISKHYVADDKKSGGSLMRIYRDTRFSKDKSPYKTNIGIQLRHEAGKDVHAPGFYIHFDPDECFLGAGLWHPEGKDLGKIRDRITAEPAKWKKARDDKKLLAHFELKGESLKRPPRGYDPEHPLIEDLKRKDFIAVANLKASQMSSSGTVDLIAERFASTKPLVRFLTQAVDLPF